MKGEQETAPKLSNCTRLLATMALTRIRDPYRPTARGPESNQSNRSTSISFVHVNDRSLYIIDRRMVSCRMGVVWGEYVPRGKSGYGYRRAT